MKKTILAILAICALTLFVNTLTACGSGKEEDGLKNYPAVEPSGSWKTDHTDWFGQENPTLSSHPVWNHVECRNWADTSEYIEMALDLSDPHSVYHPEGICGFIRFSGPERWSIGSTINWDGGFASNHTWKIGEFLRLGRLEGWDIIEGDEKYGIDISGAQYSDEVKLNHIKETEQYLRYVTAVYPQETNPSMVEYIVNLGSGYGVSLYFYISSELTQEELAIYDRIVETMVYMQ